MTPWSVRRFAGLDSYYYFGKKATRCVVPKSHGFNQEDDR